jgi:hypothetical protein
MDEYYERRYKILTIKQLLDIRQAKDIKRYPYLVDGMPQGDRSQQFRLLGAQALTFKKRPSLSFMMLALCTAVTFFLLLRKA